LASDYNHIITLEHNAVAGGFGSAVSELYQTHERYPKIRIIGYPDEFITHGSLDQLKSDLGFSPEKLADRIHQFVTSTDDARVYADG
jgi:1-deoxy-D-xylulose-5-phosphate synthase